MKWFDKKWYMFAIFVLALGGVANAQRFVSGVQVSITTEYTNINTPTPEDWMTWPVRVSALHNFSYEPHGALRQGNVVATISSDPIRGYFACEGRREGGGITPCKDETDYDPFRHVYDKEFNSLVDQGIIFSVYTANETDSLVNTANATLKTELETFIKDTVATINVDSLEESVKEELTDTITQGMTAYLDTQLEQMRSQVAAELLQDEAFLNQLREQLRIDELEE